MNKHDTIQAMNERGKLKLPFFFIVDYAMDQALVCSADEAYNQGIIFDFPLFSNLDPETCDEKVPDLQFKKRPIGFERYRKAFLNVQEQLHQGNSYLVNLTFPTPVEINATLKELFYMAQSKYKLLFKDQFIVFSPETFVKIESGLISTYPMKGTIDASLPNAHSLLLDNGKELAEHATIVDLLRNDLSIFATQVRVENFRYIETLHSNEKSLLQMSSKITGKLQDGYCSILGDILFSMLPAGSVTGAPKAKTVQLIDGIEDYQRGYYTGIAGYFDGENLDSCVLIRFIEKTDDRFTYKSGGGITAQSKINDEYQELIDKIYVPVNRNDPS
jgi:para-aminobenzoate synthetase component I